MIDTEIITSTPIIDVETDNINIDTQNNDEIEIELENENEISIELEDGGEIDVDISSPNLIETELGFSTIPTGNYNDLEHKPQINNVTLIGNLSLSNLDIQSTMDYLTNTEIERLISE